jgi:broad specificity phosphatase PhoE
LLAEYRTWADGAGSSDAAPGGGESRGRLVARYARGFRAVLLRAEARVLVVAHSLPIAFVLAARDGVPPQRRMALVEYAHPYRLAAGELERAVRILEDWCASPAW